MIHSRVMHACLRRLRAAAPIAVLALVLTARFAPATTVDSGVLRVSVGGRLFGIERFYYDQLGDSLILTSSVEGVIRTPEGEDSLKKAIVAAFTGLDYDLKFFQSNQKIHGHLLTRGLILSDTAFTAYREIDSEEGSGDRLVRPPGRMFILDPQVFALFDLVARQLHGQGFESRPISMFVLGPRDTMVDVTVTRLGVETIRWGHRSVEANKLSLKDAANELLMWSDQKGRMLRLEQPAADLLIEREPPAPPSPHRGKKG
jgi:hypothetical protein